MQDSTNVASPRIIGPASYIMLLARIPLIATVVLVATLSDLAIPGSMREALRYSIVDAPHQLVVIAVALLFACAAIRFTCEAIIELVSPDLFDAPGGAGRFAHVLPRFLAFLIGVAAGFPILKLAADPIAFGPDVNVRLRLFAAGFGILFVLIGVLVATIARGPHTPIFATEKPSALLRWMIAIFPLAVAITFAGAAVGVWRTDSGTAFHVLERYTSALLGAFDQSTLADYLRAAPERYESYILHAVLDDTPPMVATTVSPLLVVAELLSLFVACVAVRLAVAVFLDLVIPRLARSGAIGHFIRLWLPRVASAGIGLAVAWNVYRIYLGPDHIAGISDSETIWAWAIFGTFVLVGILASLGAGSSIADEDSAWHETKSIGRKCMGAAERLAALDDRWQWFFAISLIAGVVVFMVFVNIKLVGLTQWLGPVSIILLWGFTAATLFFPVAYLSHITRLPLLAFLLLAGVTFAGFDLNDNHELRLAQGTAKVGDAPETARVDSREYLDLPTWLSNRNDWDKYDRYPVFLIATEGGGIRAAYFTASILAALQERCPAFAQHTLAVSGVSGGSVGAAVFAALTADQAKNVTNAGCNLTGMEPGSMVTRARNVLKTDLLSPLLGAALFPDALQRILPFPVAEFDRSRALEYAVQNSWAQNAVGDCGQCDKDRLSKQVLDLYRPKSPVPHLFLNTTEAASGRAIPYATLRVPSLATPFREHAQIDDTAFDPLRPSPSQQERISLQDRMADDRIALSTAAMLSARFPYLTPAGRLGVTGGHYVDGGYFENSGTWLLSGLVQNLIGQQIAIKPGESALKDAAKKAVFVVVVVESEPCTRGSYGEPCGEDLQATDATWNEVMTPLRALLFTRDKRAEYSANDLFGLTAMIEQLTHETDDPAAANAPDMTLASAAAAALPTTPGTSGIGCDYPVCGVTLRFRNAAKSDVPLSWVLSRVARYSMDDAINRMSRTDVRLSPSMTPPTGREHGNNILGSYRRLICMLDARKGEQGCALPPPPVAPSTLAVTPPAKPAPAAGAPSTSPQRTISGAGLR